MTNVRSWQLVMGLVLGVFGIGVIGFVLWKTWQAPVTLLSVEGTPVKVLNPLDYLRRPEVGTPTYLLTLEGDVRLIPWNTPDEMRVTPGTRLYQGDGILVATGSAQLQLNQRGTITLEAGTDVVWASLLTGTETLKQTSGTVRWADTGSWSLRPGTALVQIGSGSGYVTMEPWRLEVEAGEVRVGYLDGSGLTTVWRVAAGQWLTIDDTRRRVRTTGVLEANY